MQTDAFKKLVNRYRANNSSKLDSKITAEKALKEIKQLALPATPIYFTLMYEVVSEIDPDLANSIQDAINTNTLNNCKAEELFIGFLTQYIYNGLPPEEVESILNTLLEEISSWLHQSKLNEKILTSEITLLSQEKLPTHVAEQVNNKILPTLQNFFNANDSLKKQVEDSSLEITQLKNELQQARNEAKTDALTNIPNRRGFNEIIACMINEADLKNTPFSIIILDIDFFKFINDEFGHLIGDSVLRYLAKQLNEETKGKDAVARIGGEEFVVLLPNTNYENAINVANNLRQKIEDNRLKVKNHNAKLKLTVSAGVATYDFNESSDELLNRADQALYKAKNSGRNKVCGAE